MHILNILSEGGWLCLSLFRSSVSFANWPIVQVLLVNLQIEAAALDRNGDDLCVQLTAINAVH